MVCILFPRLFPVVPDFLLSGFPIRTFLSLFVFWEYFFFPFDGNLFSHSLQDPSSISRQGKPNPSFTKQFHAADSSPSPPLSSSSLLFPLQVPAQLDNSPFSILRGFAISIVGLATTTTLLPLLLPLCVLGKHLRRLQHDGEFASLDEIAGEDIAVTRCFDLEDGDGRRSLVPLDLPYAGRCDGVLEDCVLI